MIIVEGADKLGKTTFCQKLQERMPGSEIVHFGLLPPDWNYYWDYVKRMSPNVIWDRGHISEFAYSYAVPRPPQIDKELNKVLEGTLRLFGVVKVGFICNPFLYAKRLREMKDDKFDAETLKRANDWFVRNEFSSIFDLPFFFRENDPWPTDSMVEQTIAMHSFVQLQCQKRLEPVVNQGSLWVFPV